MNKSLNITNFTDPSCPFAYSAEPTRWRLMWLYGDQLKWNTKMIALSGYDNETPTLPAERIGKSRLKMRKRYGMPMSDEEMIRSPESILACRAYVAASLNSPKKAERLLRELRIAVMSGALFDEQSIIDNAAHRAELIPEELNEWMKGSKVEKKLKEDAKAARTPSETALNMSHKLSKTSKGQVRYPAPSYVFTRNNETVFELPGFWPVEAYEAAIGNFLPDARRADNPKSVAEVLEWANIPLATKEVAVVCNKNIDEVRSSLKKVASFEPVGQDGFWTKLS